MKRWCGQHIFMLSQWSDEDGARMPASSEAEYSTGTQLLSRNVLFNGEVHSVH